MIILSNSFIKIISSSGLNFVFRIFGLGCSFITTVLISNLFGITTFGNYTSVITITQIFAFVFTLGIPGTLIKVIGNQRLNANQSQRLLLKGLKGAVLIALFPVLFFIFSSEYLAEELYENGALKSYFLLAGLFLPVFIVHEILLCFILATKKYLKYNLFIFVVPNILFILFLLAFWYSGMLGEYSYLAYSLAILLTVIAESIAIFKLHSQKAAIGFRTISLLKAASPLLFSGMMLYLLNWTSIVMLGLMLDEKQVGIYSIAYKIGSIGFLVITSVGTIITPRIAELYGEKNGVELKKLINNSTALIGLLTLPIAILVIVFSKSILTYFGSEAVAGSSALIIISIGVFISAMAGNVDQILNMTDNQDILRNVTIFCFCFNVLANYILIPIYGIVGSAITSLLTNALVNVLCVYYIKKKLGFYTLF